VRGGKRLALLINMWQGVVESIHVAEKAQGPTCSVDSVAATPGVWPRRRPP